MLYGQNDGVLNRQKLASRVINLPDGTLTLAIGGGWQARGYAIGRTGCRTTVLSFSGTHLRGSER